MDTSKAPTHARPDLLPVGGRRSKRQRQGEQDEIDRHAIPESLQQGDLLHRILQVSTPRRKILLTKVNWKSVYRRIHLQAGMALKSCTCLDGILLLALRMMFRGLPNPLEWS